MANFTNSTSMGLPIPTVGTAPGPAWASLLNSCLGIIDGHTHAPGSGVQITPDAIDISSDLTMNAHNLINSRSLRLAINSAPINAASDLASLYASGVDLYFNDGNGNQIQVTQSGGIAGSPGSISNLASPASAAYVSGTSTFVWQSDANKGAHMDMASAILRNLTTSSFGLTLQPPTLTSDYSLTLPTVPVANSFMQMSSGGLMSASIPVALGINTANIASGAITKPKLAALGQQISSSCGVFSTTSSGFVDVTNLTVTITSTGRPIWIGLIPDGTSGGGLGAQFGVTSGSATNFHGVITFNDATTPIAYFGYQVQGGTGSKIITPQPCFIYNIAAGTFTFKVQLEAIASTVDMNYYKLVAYEL